jgi:hypothetical protein
MIAATGPACGLEPGIGTIAERRSSMSRQINPAAFIAIGLAIGAAIGAAVDDISAGVAFGAVIGVVLFVVRRRRSNTEGTESPPDA